MYVVDVVATGVEDRLPHIDLDRTIIGVTLGELRVDRCRSAFVFGGGDSCDEVMCSRNGIQRDRDCAPRPAFGLHIDVAEQGPIRISHPELDPPAAGTRGDVDLALPASVAEVDVIEPQPVAYLQVRGIDPSLGGCLEL